MPRCAALVASLLPLLLLACTEDPYTPITRRDAGVTVNVCDETCLTRADCLNGYVCTAQRCVPETPPHFCSRDVVCRAELAGWRQDCVRDNDCPANHACVGLPSDPGWCARRPVTGAPCSQTGHEEMQMTRREDASAVTVCGLPKVRCLGGICAVACLADGDCGGEYPRCNVFSGVCECTDTSCHTNASVCTMGVCRCAQDGDCTVLGDQCRAGVCACSSVAVCQRQATSHPGTAWVCEP